MKSLVLPYGVRFMEDGRIEVFPGAEVIVKGQNGKDIYAVFHIDSGASTSIIPIDDGPNLGIDPIKGDRVLVRGVGDSTYFG
ncbi:MAG: hypothetical protein HYV54_01800, partial [Parcubacteria group bacterium]|nr:hypothetical protein [Parcubacteria group bacterium]